MPFELSVHEGPLKKPELKKISAVLNDHVPEKAKLQVFIAWAATPKMRLLNRCWRGKDKATNVLSYPQFELEDLKPLLKKPSSALYIGDVVLCLPYIKAEAKRLKKPVNHHLTHLVVHGVLHLLGYDHITTRKASTMQKLEKAVLADLGIPNPYA
ncbi:MAG TPA: rRNA maturation RNase YbeY [Alphaproteobacteria bacterium]|nr:rRNA maturation RNase YbeY [Alphaproteobacteria bacterium]